MTNHPHRGNSIFQLDGHFGCWNVLGGQIWLHPQADGTVIVSGQAHITNVPAGIALRQSHNTPRRFRVLVGKVFPSMQDARAAVIEIVQAPAREKQAANESRLTAAGYPAGLAGKDRALALKALKWTSHDDPELRAKAEATRASLTNR